MWCGWWGVSWERGVLRRLRATEGGGGMATVTVTVCLSDGPIAFGCVFGALCKSIVAVPVEVILDHALEPSYWAYELTVVLQCKRLYEYMRNKWLQMNIPSSHDGSNVSDTPVLVTVGPQLSHHRASTQLRLCTDNPLAFTSSGNPGSLCVHTDDRSGATIGSPIVLPASITNSATQLRYLCLLT